MLPQEIFKFGVSEMPFPFFSTGFFQLINTREMKQLVVYFTISSVME